MSAEQIISLAWSLLPWGIGLLVGIVALNVARLARRARHAAAVASGHVVLLVTVPKESAEKGEAGMQEKSLQDIQESIAVMEGVFGGLGGLKAERGLKAWWRGREDAISFEIVADEDVISFYVAAPPRLNAFVEQQIHSQFPHAEIEVVPDYNIFHRRGHAVAVALRFRNSNILPLRTFREMESDPLNSLTNALAKVGKDDSAAVQIVVRSAPASWRSAARSITQAMQQGKSLREAMGGASSLSKLSDLVSPPKKTDAPKPERRLTQQEEAAIKGIEDKVAKLGLDVNVRVVASSDDRRRAEAHLDNIVRTFSQHDSPQVGNSLARAGRGSDKVIRSFILRSFDERNLMVMNGQELAGLYHFPLPSTETPNIRWLTARKAPPPANLPKDGLLLGFTEYRSEKHVIRIKQDDRMRHMYIIGKSGAGKSEFIANMAAQDVLNGHGLCVIDPHGDLVESILGIVPKERADDVIVFDPSDIDRPIGLNMLESPSEEMKDFVVGEMISIFYKLFPPEMIGPMFEHTMRNLMLTLMSDDEVPGTIAEIPRLVVDPEYQKLWVKKVKDPVLLNYWEKEVAKTSDFHKSEMFGYIISKVGRFVENGMLRNIIGQQKSAFDFREIMDKKKIFLVNLSKGKIGDINANLLGLIIVTKLQMAVMGRADMPREQRQDFFVYIDEFQNFVTPSIATILSEARKYRMGLILAHQYMSQLAPKGDTEVRDAVLGNVGTMMIGRIGIEDAQVLEKEFAPVFNAFDLVNVEKFTYNSKMLIDNQTTRPFNFAPPPPVKPDPRIAGAIKQLARLKYGRDRFLVEQEILERTKLGAN